MAERDHQDVGRDRRRATNVSLDVSLDVSLIGEARRLDINLSKWLAENAEAIEESNHFAEERGLPLARHRRF